MSLGELVQSPKHQAVPPPRGVHAARATCAKHVERIARLEAELARVREAYALLLEALVIADRRSCR